MQAISPERRAQVLAEYKRLRQVGRTLSEAIVHLVKKETMDRAGEDLGILHHGTLYFDTEDVASVFMDYAIFAIRDTGKNAIDRYAAAHSFPPGSDEARWLHDRQATRYTIFRVTEASPGFGVEALDLLRDATIFVIDIGFSQSADPGVTFAGHIHPMDEFWVSTGASLPVSARLLKKLKPHIQDFRKLIRHSQPVAHEDEAEFSARVIRWCLEEGAATHIVYRDPS